MVIPDLPHEVEMAGYFEFPVLTNERGFLRNLIVHYHGNAPIAFVAAEAGISVDEGKGIMKKYELPENNSDPIVRLRGIDKLEQILSYL